MKLYVTRTSDLRIGRYLAFWLMLVACSSALVAQASGSSEGQGQAVDSAFKVATHMAEAGSVPMTKLVGARLIASDRVPSGTNEHGSSFVTPESPAPKEELWPGALIALCLLEFAGALVFVWLLLSSGSKAPRAPWN